MRKGKKCQGLHDLAVRNCEGNSYAYDSSQEFVNHNHRRGETPFPLAAVLDESGELVEYTYRRPGKARFIQHIE